MIPIEIAESSSIFKRHLRWALCISAKQPSPWSAVHWPGSTAYEQSTTSRSTSTRELGAPRRGATCSDKGVAPRFHPVLHPSARRSKRERGPRPHHAASLHKLCLQKILLPVLLTLGWSITVCPAGLQPACSGWCMVA